MTTTTIQTSKANNGTVFCFSSSSYAAARNGTGTVITSTSGLTIGQELAGNWAVYVAYLEFDTSSISVDYSINSVSLQLYGQTNIADTDAMLQARLYDFGSSLENTDYLTGSSLAALPLLATFDTTGFSTSGYNTFTENSTNFIDNITVGGVTRIVVVSDRDVSGTAPTNSEKFSAFAATDANATSKWPQLVIDYTDANQTLTPAAIASAESFGTASVTPGSVGLTPTSIASAETFNTAVLSSAYSLSPTSIASAESFGTALIESGVAHIAPHSIASGESFGTAIITPGGVTLTPTSIQSGEAFGTAVLTMLSMLLPSKIDSGEVFGVATVAAGAIHLHPTVVASAEAFGTAVLDTAFRINPIRIVSGELFPAARINTVVSLTPSRIASSESFGVAKFGFRIHIRHGLAMWVYVKEPTLLMDLWLMETDDE